MRPYYLLKEYAMFNWKYKMTDASGVKSTVALSPTAGTWLKAFMPSIIIWGGLCAVGFLAQKKAEAEDTPFDSNDYDFPGDPK